MAAESQVLDLLLRAYRMELETVLNYLANGVNLDGIRAEEIKKALLADVVDELGHATALGNRIKQVGGSVPGSLVLNEQFDQRSLQPPAETTDVVSVIQGVIAAEEEAVAGYKKLIRAAREVDDYVTEDVALTNLGDEEKHLVLFRGFLKEYKKS